MTISLGTNIRALRTMRNMDLAQGRRSDAADALATGLRIRRASDDAAGLSIAESLRADTRVYTQAIRNLSEGISIITIANSALDSLSQIITRQLELAEQAANGTYSNTQRRALDKEANALVAEYNRIGSTTTFNGVNVFTSEIKLQAGYGEESIVTVDAGGEFIDGNGFGQFSGFIDLSTSASNTTEINVADINGDGNNDIITGNWIDSSVTIITGNGDGTYNAARTINVGGNASYVEVADLNNDGNLDIVTRSSVDVAVLMGNGDGTFQFRRTYSVGSASALYGFDLADFNNDGYLDFVGSHASAGVGTGVAVLLGNSDGSFRAGNNLLPYRLPAVHLGDFDGDGNLDFVGADAASSRTLVFLGNGDGNFEIRDVGGYSTVLAADVNRDGYSDIVRYTNPSTIAVQYGSSSGSFTTGASISLGVAAQAFGRMLDVNNDGLEDLVTWNASSTGAGAVLYSNGDGTFTSAVTFTRQISGSAQPGNAAVGDLNGDGVPELLFSAANGGAGVRVFTQLGASAVKQRQLNLLTTFEARQSLARLKGELQTISSQRAIIGSQESRIQVTTNILRALSDSYMEARGRITDANIASEAAIALRESITLQIGSDLLKSANADYGIVLQLLRN